MLQKIKSYWPRALSFILELRQTTVSYSQITSCFIRELAQIVPLIFHTHRLEAAVDIEWRNFKRDNKKYQCQGYKSPNRIIDHIKRYTIKVKNLVVLIAIFSISLGALLFFFYPDLIIKVISLSVSTAQNLWDIIKQFRISEFSFFKTLILKKIESSEFPKFIATLQVTLFAVIIPFSTIVLDFVFKDYQSKDVLLKLVYKEIKVIPLTASSIFLTIFIVIGEFLDITFVSNFQLTYYCITFFWFIFNIMLVLRFIKVGMYFLIPYYRNFILTKLVETKIYPNLIKDYFRQDIYFSLASTNQNKDKNEEKVPYVNQKISMATDLGEPLSTINLSSKNKLVDVKLNYLKHVITHWTKRKKRLREKYEDDFNLKEPTLVFPLYPQKSYEGETVLYRLMNGEDVSYIDKILIKRAFIFKDISKIELLKLPSLEVEDCLKIIREPIINAIKSCNLDQFDSAFMEYNEFYLFLLKLGEGKRGEDQINLANIRTWGGRLADNWSTNYINIFEESVTVLNRQTSFFKKCSYMGSELANGILKMPSMAGLRSVIRVQGALWFRLNEWWETHVERQNNKIHNNQFPTELFPPESKTYEEVISSFIAGWESIQQKLISQNNKPNLTWKEYGLLFEAYEEHLTQLLTFISKSILIGNRYAARKLVEILIRWEGNISSSLHLQDSSDYWLTNGTKAIKVSPSLFEKPLEQVQSMLHEKDGFFPLPSQEAIFKAILKNYWQDVIICLSCFLINWSIKETSTLPPLSIEILSKLLKGSLDDEACNYGKTVFLSSVNEYLITFLRQHTHLHWQNDRYAEGLSNLYDKIDRITEAKRIGGRVYSRVGKPIDEQRSFNFILAMLVCEEGKKVELSQAEKQELNTLLQDNLVSNYLQHEINELIKEINLLNIEEVSNIFSNFITSKIITSNEEEGKDSVTIKEEIISDSTLVIFQKKLDCIKELFLDLQKLISSFQTNRIRELPISQERIFKIAKDASSEAFDNNYDQFPINLFKEIFFTAEKLKEEKINLLNFSKEELVESLEGSSVGENWHRMNLSPRVYRCLVFDIYNAIISQGTIEKIPVNTAQQYVDRVTEKADQIKSHGFEPIIIIEDFRTPQWIQEWGYSEWNHKIQLPQNFRREIKEIGQKKGYLFQLNNIAVYEGKAMFGGTLIIAKESLKKVNFRKFDSGYPVQVTFEPDTNDPWKGTLIYQWEREIEIESMPAYIITYPKQE